MGYRALWRVYCDGCCLPGPTCRKSRYSEARALAKGWKSVWYKYGQHHLCPECAKSPPDWWPVRKDHENDSSTQVDV